MSEQEIAVSRRNPTFTAAPLDMSDLRGIALRGWPLWLLAVILGLGGGIALLTHLPPSYKAGVGLMLERSANNYLQTQRVSHGPDLGLDAYSQTQVVTSEMVLLPVIRKLDLLNDPEFGCPAKNAQSVEAPTGFLVKVRSSLRKLKSYAGFNAPERILQKCDEATVFGAVLGNMRVWWESQPSVMNISFESRTPEKAAKIANEIAESYIASTLQSKQRTTQLATKVMSERLAELRAKAADAESQVLKFKLANNLIASDTHVLPSDQLTSLTNHVANARIAMLDARARWESVQQAGSAGALASYIPDNNLIVRLRERYMDIATSAAELERRVGKNHAAAIKLRDQQAEISAAITAERKRIASSFGDQFEVARSRYDELISALPNSTSKASAAVEDTARLRELEGTADTYRNLYTSMLKSVSEADRPENDLLVLPYARILTHAAVPTRTESSKKRLIVLGGSSLIGLLFGVVLTFLWHWPVGVFRTAGQVKRSLGLMPLIVPRVGKRNTRLAEYCLDMPYSRFAEAVRMLWSLISVAKREGDAKVVCVVASLANEGKTTLAANLATQVSKDAGARTLLIDADFHRQTLTRLMAPSAYHGLREALDSPENLADFVFKSERSGVDVLPCPTSDDITNAAQLLGSSNMEELLRQARASYDLVVIEPPPISLLADCRMLAPYCDGFVFVIEWGKTTQRLVLETFSEVPDLWERVLCVVLNKADPMALRSIESYKGGKYRTYFREDKVSQIKKQSTKSTIKTGDEAVKAAEKTRSRAA